jgi:elongation factor G
MLSRQPIGLLRNLGIIAHIDAGKTTCAERILLYTGKIRVAGEVHHGDTELDYGPQEREMGITISAAATTVSWTPSAGLRAGVAHAISLIDTPGHVDFTIEVERSLRVLDGAIAVFDAGNGVEPQSETVWRQADRYGVPRIAFVNKMDKVGASFEDCVASIRARLGANAVPVQLPLGEESAHRGVIDLLRLEAVVFDDASKGSSFEVIAVPAELLPAARRARASLVEACADVDEGILAAFVEGRSDEVTAEALERALRVATLSLRAVPVLCGSAHKNKGIQMLLDAVCAYLPSPADVPAVRGHEPGSGREVTRAADDEAPFCALAFKVMTLDRVGLVTLLRVYAGRLRAGAAVLDASTGRTERVGRLVSLHGNKAVDAEVAGAGAIVAAIGLRHVRSGDTLTDPRSPLVLAGLVIPEPVLELSIEPRTATDQERLGSALGRLALEDPSFRVATSDETGQTLLRGMGELHLTILVDRLRREHRVEVVTGRPSVSYRETLGRRAQGEYKLSKQNGGPGQFAHVVLGIGPGAPGSGLLFSDRARGGVIPRELVPAIEHGVRGAMSRGVVAGYPMVDVEVELLDGSTHPVDSRPPAFEVAASMAFKLAAEAAEAHVLEPIMEVEVTVPAEFLGEALGDVHARRGEVRAVVERGGARVVTALVPLRALFGHVGDLRGKTQGRASATMRLSGYARVPAAVEQELRAGAPAARVAGR